MPFAIVLHRYGSSDELRFEEVPRPALASEELRLRVRATAVNRTDVEIRAGHWPIRKDAPFPYVPGVEAVGNVIEVGGRIRDFALGDTAITMMMGMGGVRAERPGGYAEEVVVPAAHCAAVPPDIDPVALAAFGLAGITALNGLRIAGAAAGRRILVTGAGGGVGACAICIGKALDATMLAMTSDSAKSASLRDLGAATVLCIPRGEAAELPEVDGVVDTVGGAGFGSVVAALAPGGRLCLVGGAGGEAVTFSAWELMHEIVLTGWSSEKLDGPDLRRDIATLTRLLREGSLRPPPATRFHLSEAGAAHKAMESGAHVGRLLLLPDDPT